jgi:hypothetical protein
MLSPFLPRNTSLTRLDELALNFMISVIKGIKPKGQVESMLAAQMAATQMLSMRFAVSKLTRAG